MRYRTEYADIVVDDDKGAHRLLVEVKAISGKSSEWATRLRAMLIEIGNLHTEAFTMIALPDTFYVWKPGATPEAQPDCKVASALLLNIYSSENELLALGPVGLRSVVDLWVEGIATGWSVLPRTDDTMCLHESGLISAIAGLWSHHAPRHVSA